MALLTDILVFFFSELVSLAGDTDVPLLRVFDADPGVVAAAACGVLVCARWVVAALAAVWGVD